jgi:proteic killer suppression protein
VPVLISFGDRATEDLFHGRTARGARRFPASVIPAALRKMDMLNAAASLGDLRSPPGNHLEALKGTLKGFFSIRVNEQWRLIFKWNAGSVSAVRLLDYHE